MTEDEMKRNFKMSKADLCMFASILANTLTRDIADLTPFGVTTAKIAELKTLGDDYEVYFLIYPKIFAATTPTKAS